MKDSELPTVYVGIPTGSIKSYASLYMLAALRNIYYPPEKICVNFAVTDRGDGASRQYLKHLTGLIENSNFPFEVHMFITEPSEEETERWGPYVAVILNLHRLRLDFLSKPEWQYFWCVGGDNIVGTGTLRRLLALNADVAGALIRQRPNRGRRFDPDGDQDAKSLQPMFWEYVWSPSDVRSRRDLEPKLKNSLLRGWVEMPPMKLKWLKKGETIRNCNFGSGCELVRRTVLEHIGYYLGNGYHSEDLHFLQWSNFLGFDSALDPAVVCAHFDPDGRLY